MNPFHAELLKAIKSTDPAKKDLVFKARYEGYIHPSFGLSIPQLRLVGKRFKREHKDLSLSEFSALLDSLYAGKSADEKFMAGMLLGYFNKLRVQLDLKHFDKWLDELSGWAEVDNTCQSTYEVDDYLNNWSEWEKFIQKLSISGNVHKRRASLVFLTHPTSKSDDKRLHELAFETIEKLKSEKDILITKAISWLLRSMSETNKVEVKKYVEANLDTLPKIAIRETLRKIETGKK